MRLIIIDGLDGSGKSTQARLVKKRYLDRGETVILREHPSNDNPYGKKAKNALLGRGKVNKIKASLYYAMDVIRSVRKYQGKADNIIMVRYLMGVAYLPYPLAKILYHFSHCFYPPQSICSSWIWNQKSPWEECQNGMKQKCLKIWMT